MGYTYEYARPMVTVDMIVIRVNNSLAEILLIERGKEPFAGMWALPGGFVDMDEDLQDAAHRELQEETSLLVDELSQFKTYGKPGRDPRGRTISIVFHGKVEYHCSAIRSGDDAADTRWFNINELPDLAFDHAVIVKDFLDD